MQQTFQGRMLSCSHGEVAKTSWSTLDVVKEGARVAVGIGVRVGGTAVAVGCAVAVGRGVAVASSPQATAIMSTSSRGTKIRNLGLSNRLYDIITSLLAST
jgi:hypothetical protein